MRLVKGLRKYSSEIALIVVTLLLSLAFFNRVAILSVKGSSMEPTYRDGTRLLLKKDKEVERDSLIIFNADDSWSIKKQPFLKRAVGLPGDRITIRNGKLLINGLAREEVNCLNKDLSVILKDDEYFVMGDNRASSNDSVSQYCKGNDIFTITKDDIVATGEELIKFGR